jgi:hypothetical protein
VVWPTSATGSVTPILLNSEQNNWGAPLVWVMAKHESVYTTYSQILLGLSLSASPCLSLFVFGKNHVADSLRILCLCRLVGSPFVFVGNGVSRFFARFDRAKKLASYALLIDGLTLGIAVALLIYG